MQQYMKCEKCNERNWLVDGMICRSCYYEIMNDLTYKDHEN